MSVARDECDRPTPASGSPLKPVRRRSTALGGRAVGRSPSRRGTRARWRSSAASTLLFVNAGGPPAGTALSFDDDAWKGAFELLVLSAVRMVRLAVPSMKSRGGGAIVVSTSSAVKEPIPNLALSNIVRSSVSAMSKTLANELAADKHPGQSPDARPHRHGPRPRARHDPRQGQRGVRRRRPGVLIRRRFRSADTGKPAEFANAAVFLFSDAARYITGASLQVDGGLIRTG